MRTRLCANLAAKRHTRFSTPPLIPKTLCSSLNGIVWTVLVSLQNPRICGRRCGRPVFPTSLIFTFLRKANKDGCNQRVYERRAETRAATANRDGAFCGDVAGRSAAIVLYPFNSRQAKPLAFFLSPRDLIQASYSSILRVSLGAFKSP